MHMHGWAFAMSPIYMEGAQGWFWADLLSSSNC